MFGVLVHECRYENHRSYHYDHQTVELGILTGQLVDDTARLSSSLGEDTGGWTGERKGVCPPTGSSTSSYC